MVAKRTFTTEELDQIISLFKDGHFIKEIADQFNSWEGCIKRELQNAGFNTSRKIEFTPEQVQHLLVLYKTESLDAMADKMGCKRSVVTRLLRENGAIIRRRGKAQKYFIIDGKKFCRQCSLEKSTTEFGLHSGAHDGLQATCRACQVKTQRNNKLKQKFGITEAEYDAMLESQNGVCAICEQPETRVKFGKPTMLAVDHNHKTGKIRQLICSKCNMAIGLINESPIRCDKIKDYLIRHNGLSPE